MWRLLLLACIACQQPKQPLQPSFFTAKPDPDAPRTCSQTLDCYASCVPTTEECMLLCDQRGAPAEVRRARDVANCRAIAECVDRACEEERCAAQLHACSAPRYVPPPSPMQPPPVMQPQPMQPPPAPH